MSEEIMNTSTKKPVSSSAKKGRKRKTQSKKIPLRIYAITNTNNLNIRGGPSKSYPVVGRLQKEHNTRVIGRTDNSDWLFITTGFISGWVMTQYMKITSSLEEIAIIQADELSKYIYSIPINSNYLPTPDSEIYKPPSTFEIAPVAQILGKLSTTPPSSIQDIAASQTAILVNYYNLGLEQARKSFNWALTAAVIGFLFFLLSLFLVIFQDMQNASVISLISGSLIEIISGINFYLYGKSITQLANFQTYLDRTQSILLANSICEGLSNTYKHKTRSELVKIIANNNGLEKDLQNKINLFQKG